MTTRQYWPKEDLRGRKFGRLTVREFGGWRTDAKSGNRRAMWVCDCECGTVDVFVSASNLTAGQRSTKSCGCLQREAVSEGMIKSSPDNPVAARNRAYHAMRRNRMKHDNFEWEFENDDQWLVLVKSDCYYCGAKATRPYDCNGTKSKHGKFYCNGMDRYDNDKGYTIENVVPCCWICNRMKGKMHGDDFIAWVRRIAAIHGTGST